MKKVIVILIIIAAAVAIFAVVAGQNDLFTTEAEKPVVEKPAVSEPEYLKNDVKVPVKAMKMQKIRLIDKEKLRENLKKMKEERDKNPDKTPRFQKKRESCGE